MKKLKDSLPIIGSVFLLLLTIVNFTIDNNVVTGVVSAVFFVIVLVIFLATRKVDN